VRRAKLAINLPVSRLGFKAPRKQTMMFDGIPAAKCRRAHSGIHRLKEKLFPPQRAWPPPIRETGEKIRARSAAF